MDKTKPTLKEIPTDYHKRVFISEPVIDPKPTKRDLLGEKLAEAISEGAKESDRILKEYLESKKLTK